MKRVKMPKPIAASELTIIRMVAGKEKVISKVIENGDLKEWVGIGWLTIRPATARDRMRYRTVINSEPSPAERRAKCRKKK
jgi:hypothetical protein